MRTEAEVLHPDEAVARVAARQHGVVTLAQLAAAGLGRRGVDWRVRTGRLRRLHRGVYLVGPTLPPHARAIAAVLACGDTAVLSHRAAAGLWQLPVTPSKAAVDVTVPAHKRAKRAGIRTHRGDSVESTKRHSIRVTTPARTILDFAEQGTARELERAFDEALTTNLLRTSHLRTALHHHPHRRGARAIRALLEREHGTTMTRSQAEELALEIVRAADLPHPELNASLAGREIDLFWRDHGFGVEIDGYGFHGRTRARFEDDHQKDAELEAADLTVIRVTHRQLTIGRDATIARIARGLALARARTYGISPSDVIRRSSE